MNTLKNELALLIVTVTLLVMLTVLLVFHIVPYSDPTVSTILTTIVAFWYLRSAFAWGPTPPTSPPAPIVPTPPVVNEPVPIVLTKGASGI